MLAAPVSEAPIARLAATTTLAEELGACLPTPMYAGAGPDGEVLWVKDDGCTGRPYGGNKVRKLGRLFELARARGFARVLTVGAAGSHHVLATGLYAPAYGLTASAILTAQPFTPHALGTLRAIIATGADLIPWSGPGAALRAAKAAPGAFLIGPGGLSGRAAWGYAEAALELSEQFAGLGRRPPDWVVVACGSGGTAAGLCVGLASLGLRTRVLAVAVNHNPLLRQLVLWQADSLLTLWRAAGQAAPSLAQVAARLQVSSDFVGPGYGAKTLAAQDAMSLAAGVGLELDMTYTAKAYAAALVLARDAEEVVYWHTLSAVTPKPASEAPAPDALRRLLRE